MAPKKAKSKKALETPEERAVRLEAEALAAREGARRREEAARLRLRERQMREQAYARMNNIKIHNQWRRIMRMAKTDELREEIEILAQSHERDIDRRDAIIQMLDRDLEDAEEQYGTALRGHLRVIESMLDLQYARMRGLRQQSEAAFKALEDEAEGEKAEIMAAHNRQKKDMADMMAAMEAQFADAESDARQEFEGAREEIRNRSSEEYNVLKISLEGQIEELERTFDSTHQAYLANTDARKNAFKTLTKSDAGAARIIEQRMRKLLHVQEQLTHWRTKIVTNGREWETRNKALRVEKDIMARHYASLKAAMEAFRVQQNGRLKQLSLASSSAHAQLKQRLGCAERILKVAELCRKLETEQEKVLPFGGPLDAMLPPAAEGPAAQAAAEGPAAQAAAEGPAGLPAAGDQAVAGTAESAAAEEGSTSSDDSEEEETVKAQPDGRAAAQQQQQQPADTFVQHSSHALNAQQQRVGEWDYLNNLFQRYNRVLIDKAGVDKERARLARENRDLRNILRQYLDGIAVNADVMDSPTNPLLIVNQRLQLTLAERKKLFEQQAAMQQAVTAVQAAVSVR